MPPRKKFIDFANTLEERIKHGDYLFGELPSERILANEAGISHMTVRKAMGMLLENGVLRRKDNGRMEVNTGKQGFFGVLVPVYSTTVYSFWYNIIKQCMDKLGLRCRRIDFVHWDDPTVQEALNNLSGVFMMPPREDFTPELAERFNSSKTPFVLIADDYSEYGIRSIMPQKYSHVQDLLDYIASFGHRRIDCLNTEPLIPMDQKRLAQWKLWLSSRSCEGNLYNDPVKSYEHAHFKSRELVLRMIDSGEFDSTAIACTSQGVAMGVMSALWSRGLKVGEDVSVATFNGEGMGRMFCPPLTSLDVPDMEPYVRLCIDWMLDPDKNWYGSLLLAPENPELFKGESVGPFKAR